AWTTAYRHPLPPRHRFPMSKYDLIPEQLRYEGTCTDENFFAPGELADADILRVHDADYWHRLQNLELTPYEARRTGFPLSASLVQRERVITQGTHTPAHYPMQSGVAMNVAGGTHHAFADRGEGFCLLNDQAVAAAYLLANRLAERIVIIDLDVHQGNGTARLFQDDPRVFTLSVHGAKNYPLRKEQSDRDVPLPDETGDAVYLRMLEGELTNTVEPFRPDFAFFQAGVDVLATDRLGRLSLTTDGCRRRDETVFRWCRQHRVPVVACMGGGYSPRVATIVDAHAETFRAAQRVYF
ncbi:MAG: histone deacetylase, partial [Catalinimonas sp.]